MKNSTLFIMVFLATVSTGFAQKATSDQQALALTEKMQTQIKFNDDTKAKVYAINLDFIVKTQQLRDSDAGKAQKFKSLKSYDDKRATELKKVLTPSEYKLFETFREENREEMKQRYKDRKNE
ncbi:MAG: hypothetical protein EOO50_05590 [Flavobacterium sp.]|uniref:hypothetical protein n=1 Tax=Flavobacterium sp. TaxID=239 RepID=UPI001210EC2B|nr:hypothetical protein [Flavobacterium sp.]RZJ67460.1 MAG: hypothetical protein EOO50_05590 [Flavobacterium sp.]